MSQPVPERPIPAGCKRSACGVAGTLDLLGDKWTLLVVRDLLMGKQTYSEFQKSPEGIPTNILAERLKRLQQAGIIEKKKYQERPVRYSYHLTTKGQDLGPVLHSMLVWASKYIPGTYTLDEVGRMMAQAGKRAS
ncbi:MAG TPA: transcriptional regulator [Gammaproteobacteria bacterium]|nr:transcriptional regulator [Gammaproteobacteria bacterium]